MNAALPRGYLCVVGRVALALLSPSAAWANCANPSATEGEFIYNVDYKAMQFCDGTNWISITGSSSGAAGVMDDNKGGLTVSGSGAMWTINSASIQYSKIQNVSGSSLLGRYAATSGLTTSSGSVQTGHAGSSGTIIVIELP